MFVIDLFKNAKEYNADNPRLDEAVIQTTEVILEWNSVATEELNDENTKKAVDLHHVRPSKTHNNEVKVDQPILQAVICRIIRILMENEGLREDQLNEHEYEVTTERTMLSLGYAHKSDEKNPKLKQFYNCMTD